MQKQCLEEKDEIVKEEIMEICFALKQFEIIR